MKTAVSIPDEVFESAERLARRTKKSRSQVFSDALREYVARHAPDEVTAQGEVWWADLPVPQGSDPRFRRPVAIAQGDALNR